MPTHRSTAPGARSDRFERLFADHHPAVAAYLLRRCPGREDAEDAAAEVFAVA